MPDYEDKAFANASKDDMKMADKDEQEKQKDKVCVFYCERHHLICVNKEAGVVITLPFCRVLSVSASKHHIENNLNYQNTHTHRS